MDKFKVRDRRGTNRFFVDNVLLRGGWGAKIGPYGIAVYNALALHVDADYQSGYPSYSLIAKLTGMSDRQAMRKIAELEELNIISKQSRFSDTKGNQTSNEYVLLSSDNWVKVPSPYDSESPPPMTQSHPPYDSESPEQEPSKQNPIEQYIPAPKTKNGHSQLDPLTGIFQASVKGVSESTAPNPADQWLACSGTFAKAWQAVRGEVPNKQIRESMTILEQEDGADLSRWRLALVQCEENYPGHRASFVRVCEVYRAGGKYEDWKATLKQGEQNNGRQNGTSKKAITRDYEPVEREVFDLATGKVITVKS